jgi:Tol biopolymer transport system component
VVKRPGGRTLERYRWKTAPVEGWDEPVWAPDERAIVIPGDICEGGGFCTEVSRLYVADFRKRVVRRVSLVLSVDDHMPAWSPNGRRIAFIACTRATTKCYLALMAPDGSGRRILTHKVELGCCTSLAWAPDGRAIAFARPFGPEAPSRTDPAPQRWGVYVVRLDGSLRRVAATPIMKELGMYVAWSRDSQRLAFSDKRGIFVVDVRSRRTRRLTPLGQRGGALVESLRANSLHEWRKRLHRPPWKTSYTDIRVGQRTGP